MKKFKTINFKSLSWSFTIFLIGTFAVSLFISTSLYEMSTFIVPIVLFFSVFGILGFVGFIEMIILLRKHFILKNVLKNGTVTVGEYECMGKSLLLEGIFERSIDSKICAQAIFSYLVGNEKRRCKSCTVYTYDEIKKLREFKSFTVKYKGKYAIICDTRLLSNSDYSNEIEEINQPAKNKSLTSYNDSNEQTQKFTLTIQDIEVTIIENPKTKDLENAVSALKNGIDSFIVLESSLPIDDFIFIQATGFEWNKCHTEVQYKDGEKLRVYGRDKMTETELLALLNDFIIYKVPNISNWKHIGDF